ncbi:MAG: hypothetical protein IPH77_11910 [Ignavibacteria bacterium]|nr:hypothetical protein [Ignavibacteria bacterium]
MAETYDRQYHGLLQTSFIQRYHGAKIRIYQDAVDAMPKERIPAADAGDMSI